MDTGFIYLHGFASSPGSAKATAFKKEFDRGCYPLIVPDLEGGDFENLTLSRQVRTIEGCLDQFPEKRFGLIGSSLGGYLAALVAQRRKEVAAVYLMAPAFNFLQRWRQRLKDELSTFPGNSDLIWIFHFRYNKNVPLKAGIFKDAEKWDRVPMDRQLPMRIVHGIHDDSVPVKESRDFSEHRPWCRLEELDADHGLLSHVDWILKDCLAFFETEHLL